MKFLALAVLTTLLPNALATDFRVTCSPFKRERVDPIVSPGKEASHMHTFWGSRAIGADPITVDELRDSCHTCDNAFDHSAYWIPTLYYVSKNATVPVKVAIFHVYYHGQAETREPFPDDFAILAGNPDLTEEEAKAQGGIGMAWGFESSTEVKEAWELPKQKGSGWLRGNVPFPTSVVKDESIGRYRECTTKNEAGCFGVIRMFFAVWYDLRDEWFDFQDGAYLTLASGGGQTYHGDFIYGWDSSVAYDLVRNSSGVTTPANQSAACQALNKADPFLQKADWNAMLEAKAGNGSVVVGTYDRGLTITDGDSVNSTWSGAWGEVGTAVNASAPAAVSNATSVVSQPASSTLSISVEKEDVSSTPTPVSSSEVPVSYSNDTTTPVPSSTHVPAAISSTPSSTASTTHASKLAEAESNESTTTPTPTRAAACGAPVHTRKSRRGDLRRAH